MRFSVPIRAWCSVDTVAYNAYGVSELWDQVKEIDEGHPVAQITYIPQ